MIKAIFFDVDGTLVSFVTHRMSPALPNALQALRAKGIQLFLCTGRSPSMLPQLYDVFPFDGWGAFNGQLCRCADRFVRQVPIARRTAAELVDALEVLDTPCIFLEREDTYFNRYDPRTTAFMLDLQLPLPPVRGTRAALAGELYQCVAFLSQAEEPRLWELAPSLTATRWHPDFIDVIPAGGGKDQGMTAILSALGIAPEETMAFGDGGNDLPMLRLAGVGVAMGSASAEVRAGADYVTGTVDEDGVISALRHFALL